jgi:hypothetical protein
MFSSGPYIAIALAFTLAVQYSPLAAAHDVQFHIELAVRDDSVTKRSCYGAVASAVASALYLSAPGVTLPRLT